MSDALAFEAVKMSWKQDKEGFVLTLRVHPQDVKEPIAMAPIGQQWTIALIKTPGPESQPHAAASLPGKAPDEVGKSGIHPLVQKAGILAKSVDFQKWVDEQEPANPPTEISDVDFAVAYIRSECGIQSRKELATNPEAAAKFEKLVQRYYEETR